MSKQKNKQSELPSKIKKSDRKEIILAALYLFAKHDREKEVSRSEIVDCLREVQKEFPAGYEFPEKLPYVSYELDSDLGDLWLHQGYIRKWKYGQRNIPLFPKNFVALQPLGRVHAKKIMETLSPEMIEALNKAVELAIENYKKT